MRKSPEGGVFLLRIGSSLEMLRSSMIGIGLSGKALYACSTRGVIT